MSRRSVEYACQKQISDVLTIDIAPAGKVSKDGVCWWSIDIAAYSGSAPGARTGRGVIAGIPDINVLYRGRSHFVFSATD